MDNPDKDQKNDAERPEGAEPVSQPVEQTGSPAPSDTAQASEAEVLEQPAPKPEPAPEPEPVPQPEPDALEQLRQENERIRGQLLRTAADFDNYRKRSRREIEDAARSSRFELLRDLLPVFDNLERAVMHAEQATDARSVADGVKMVLRQFHDSLSKIGIKRVQTVGEPFDPNVHEAIQQLATADQPPGTVVAEVQAGYASEDRLVRAAMVVVAKAPPEPPPEPVDSGSAN